jgi:hypothetical protein
MRTKYVLAALVLWVGAASCAKDGSDKGNGATGGNVKSSAVADAKPQAAKHPGTAGAPSTPSIPAGAEWTIYCTTIPGNGHVLQATQLRDQLVKSTGMRDWYVIHGDSESTLYYGFYKSMDKSAKATREKIDAMTDATGKRPFRNAVIVEVTAPDPEAPPQWDLANAPPGMEWSVQIAAYEGSPQRKKYAVDAVREARAQGVPAYYFHGPSVSSVCVGAWPKQAVRGEMEPAFNDPNEKRTLEQIAQQQPADLIVLPPGMPGGNREVQTRRGRVRTVSTQLEVADPTLLGTMKEYPNHYRNGEPEGVNTKNGVQPKPSFLVKIPRRSNSLLGGDTSVAGAGNGAGSPSGHPGPADAILSQPAGERRPTPAPAPAPGYGKLPSLGGN